MLSAKDAVQLARKYMVEIFGTIDGLNVEEIELAEDEQIWSVTMGFWEYIPEPTRQIPNALSSILGPEVRKVRRTYKVLKISANSGNVLSMKIRSVPSADPS